MKPNARTSNIRNAIFGAVWLTVPTLLWTLVFHSFVLGVDPLFVRAICARLPRPAVIVIRAAWALNFVIAVLWVWNISPPTYLFYLRQALPFSPPAVLLLIAVGVALLAWFVLYRDCCAGRPTTLAFAGAGLALLLLKGGLTAFDGQGHLQHRIKSSTLTAARLAYLTAVQKNTSSLGDGARGTFDSFLRDRHVLPDKLVLMIVESWSERLPELEAMTAELRSARVDVLSHGFVSYKGATLSGEFRELCSLWLVPTGGMFDGTRPACAPQRMVQRGYDTIGLHGYNGAFYARAAFWKEFGIAERLFKDDMPALASCRGPFPGICDGALARRGSDELFKDQRKRFVYMLTLSSHEPIPAEALGQPPGALFGKIAVLHPSQVVTRRAISSLVEELRRAGLGHCVVGYVVGDHQPPSTPAGIFPPGQVPYIAFAANCGGRM